MSIRVQTSQPQNNGDFCNDDEQLSEAIETIFPMMAEDAFLVWNTHHIPLSYKYDISYMIDDLLELLMALRVEPTGEMKIAWPSNTFACEWFISWDEKNIKIDSTWTSVLGHIEDLLNGVKRVDMEKYLFQCEWKKLLKTLIDNLSECNYNINNLINFENLIIEFEAIKEMGVLYRKN